MAPGGYYCPRCTCSDCMGTRSFHPLTTTTATMGANHWPPFIIEVFDVAPVPVKGCYGRVYPAGRSTRAPRWSEDDFERWAAQYEDEREARKLSRPRRRPRRPPRPHVPSFWREQRGWLVHRQRSPNRTNPMSIAKAARKALS